MKFAEPYWLAAGLAIIALMMVLYRAFDLRQRAALAEFASSHLLDKLTASFSPARRRFKRVLFLAALACVFVAMSRPQWGYHWEEEKQRGIDLLFAIDTSKSMLTQDVTPDRLTRAKLATVDFVRKLDGDRVGLIAFAGEAFLQAPLTLDYDAFNEALDAIDTNVIPRGGTDVARAIEEAQSAFGKSKQNKKILILITDGEDLEAKGIDAARAAAKEGLTIYTVGVGSPAGGVIPVPGNGGGTDFVKDEAGQFVKSRLDESTLKQIATVTGGLYQPLGQQGEGLQAIYDQALASLPKQDLASKRQKVFEERFQWPLAGGIFLLLASLTIGTRKRDPRKTRRAASTPEPAVRAGALILTLSVFSMEADASVQSAERAYQKGDFSTAQSEYEKAAAQHPGTAPLQFNYGAAAYKSGEFSDALPAFQKALGTDDVAVQQQSYYNLGNTQYRLGQKNEKAKPEDTIKTWQSALGSYDAALKLKPDDADAKFNRDFVEKKLQQLQKQQQQKQDQKKDQQKPDDKNQPDQQPKDQSGNQDQKPDQKPDPNKPGEQSQPKDQSGGQQNQDQAKSGQQPDSQPKGQGKDGQDSSTAGDQNKDGQGKPEQKDQNPGKQQTEQTAKNQDKPEGKRGQTNPDQQPGKQSDKEEQAEEARPGKLTRQEAKDLLNSLKSGEHALPVTTDNRTAADHPQDQTVRKDW